jgi:hypothetical protein
MHAVYDLCQKGEKLMKHITGNTDRILLALFSIFLFIITVDPHSAEASDSKATFTVQ